MQSGLLTSAMGIARADFASGHGEVGLTAGLRVRGRTRRAELKLKFRWCRGPHV